MDDGRCQLRAGDDTVLILRGRTVSELLPELFRYLDGTHTIPEISEKCGQLVREDDLLTVLRQLDQEGILEEGAAVPPTAITAKELERYAHQLLFFSHFRGDKYEFQTKLKRARVAVIGLGSLGAAVVVSLAKAGVGEIIAIESEGGSCGLSSLAAGANPDTTVVIVERETESDVDVECAIEGSGVVAVAIDRLRPSMYHRVNRACLDRRIPWILCSPLNSIEGIVGPFFVPHETCCYTCYEQRSRSNMDAYEEYIAYEEYLEKRKGCTAEYGYLSPFPIVIGNLVALELIKHLTQFVPPETYGAMLCINCLTLRADCHSVLKLPRCPVCGPAAHAPPTALWSR